MLTVAEYAALGEDNEQRWELQEGALVMSPKPTPRHMLAVGALLVQLSSQVPPGLRVIPEVDVDLQLAPLDQPGSVRVPDLLVVGQDAVDRVRREGGCRERPRSSSSWRSCHRARSGWTT
jgi:hypothetical protein